MRWANLRHTLVQTSASDLRAQDLLTVMDKYERKGSEEIARGMSLDQGGRENANRKILESFDTWNVVFTSDFALDDPINMDHWLQLYSTSNDSEAWYGHNLLAHDVLLSKDFFAPRTYFYPPSATAYWLNASADREELCSLITNKIMWKAVAKQAIGR